VILCKSLPNSLRAFAANKMSKMFIGCHLSCRNK
jgi:hypothetical protein